MFSVPHPCRHMKCLGFTNKNYIIQLTLVQLTQDNNLGLGPSCHIYTLDSETTCERGYSYMSGHYSDMLHCTNFCGNIVSWQIVGENRSV